MREPRKRPGFWWSFFYGRRRRGFPWLLGGMFLAVFVFALLFAIPGGDELSRTIAGVFIGLLAGGIALSIIVIALLRPRRRP